MSDEQQNGTAVVKAPTKVSLIQTMAHRFNMEPMVFLETVKKTVFPQDQPVSNEQVAAFLAVSQQYDLNPFTREIFAFPSKRGGIQPIVSIDGWVKLIVTHPQYDGMDIQMEIGNDGKPISCTCTIFRKDRQHTTPITEYYDECYRDTEPWHKMPKRMMRHKAIKESGRVTMGFGGIQDEDEGLDAIRNITSESVEISRETNSKTEALKEKIGAKKNAKEKPVEVSAPVETAAASPVEETPSPAPEASPIAEELPPFDLDTPQPEEDGERILTDQERKILVDILQAQCTTKEKGQAAMKAARQKFMEYGYSKTQDIRLKDYVALIEWAKTLKV